MLNPSKADGQTDDPTIRRCMSFSRAWGYGGIIVVNLFALRATDPDELDLADEPVGPDNDRHIAQACTSLSPLRRPVIIAAWGRIRGRGRALYMSCHLSGTMSGASA